MSDIVANVESVRERIAAAARRVGRSPDAVTLMAVSKTVEPSRIEAALEAGITVLGESRVQEAEGKMTRVVGAASWHLVGRLQSNKARLAGGLFDAIHSIDRSGLAERASEGAVQAEKDLDVYVQVDLREEDEERRREVTAALCRTVEQLPGLRLRGLMTLPPFDPDAEAARPYFVRLRRLRDALREDGIAGLEGLSMGMTNDFEVAVEEGATVVRVGTAIFGPRPR